MFNILPFLQVIQGAQAQALAGKIINTSQGQFIIGPNGQLLSTQKLIQNHLTNNQQPTTVKFVAAAPTVVTTQLPAARSASLLGTTVTTTTPRLAVASSASVGGTTTVASARAGPVAMPLISAVAGGGGQTTQVLRQSPTVVAAGKPATIQLGVATSGLLNSSSSGAAGVVKGSPVAGAVVSRANPAFNQVILNALSNRGLLTQQQNGKFVYVGGEKTAGTGINSSPADTSKSTLVQGKISIFRTSLFASDWA